MKALRQACMMLAQKHYNSTLHAINKENYALQAERKTRSNRVDTDMWIEFDEVSAEARLSRAETQKEIDKIFAAKIALDPDSPERQVLELKSRELSHSINLSKAEVCARRVEIRRKALTAHDKVDTWYNDTMADIQRRKEAAGEAHRLTVSIIAGASTREQLVDIYHELGGIDMPADTEEESTESETETTTDNTETL